FVSLTHELGMEALVEAFDKEDIHSGLAAGARLIGINNRNLHTFEINLQRGFCLAPLIPDPVLRVSESGLASPSDIRQMKQSGFHAALVGEALLSASDPGAKLAELLEGSL